MPPSALFRPVRALLRNFAFLFLLGGALPLAASCTPGDVGAPCNHGILEDPGQSLVTFPALYCDQLLCVYAQSTEPAAVTCDMDAQCNANPKDTTFFCDENGMCALRLDYVLERSMCSKRCSSKDDCNNKGIKRNVAKGTECRGDFECVRQQKLGEFCCEKLCVCGDDLIGNSGSSIEEDCSTGMLEGCCDKDPRPEACGGG